MAWQKGQRNRGRQDKRSVETQRPVKTGLSIGENLVSADLPVIECRTKRDALQRESSMGEEPARTDISRNSNAAAKKK